MPSQSSSPTMSRLPVIQNEQQARTCGRFFAKSVFQPVSWSIVGTQPQDDVVLYEHICHQTNTHAVRAVRTIDDPQITLAQLEALISSSYRYEVFRHLLPESFYDGSCVVDYRGLEHGASGENEHVNVQAVSWRSYTSAPGLENHLLLEYSLRTQLQRSRQIVTERGSRKTIKRTKSVPSLLYLLRPIDFPYVGLKRRAFQRACLSQNAFQITMILQEQCPATKGLTMEVILTSTYDPTFQRRANTIASGTGHRLRASSVYQPLMQQQLLWKDALNLTRLSMLLCREPSSSSSSFLRRSSIFSSDASLTSSSITVHSGCSICKKKFHAFRWKHYCEVCDQAACGQCLSVIANPTMSLRKKKRVCSRCLYGPSESQPAAVQPPVTTTSRRHSSPKEVPLSAPQESMDDNDFDAIDALLAPPVGRTRRAQTVTGAPVTCSTEPSVDSFEFLIRSQPSRTLKDTLNGLRLRASDGGSTTMLSVDPSRRDTTLTLLYPTPMADYDLDFNWLHPFPKAPVHCPNDEMARVQCLHTALGIETIETELPSAFVARAQDDVMLPQLLDQVLRHVAMDFDACAIHLVDRLIVYCLASASLSENQQPVLEDMVPRHESASSYSVFYNQPFFVRDLQHDDRFRAHPLVTDLDATSYLSFPLYASIDNRASKCIGTLDIWKTRFNANPDHQALAPAEWRSQLEFLTMEISLRILELAKEQSQRPSSIESQELLLPLKIRTRATSKACSIDGTASCDSRSSTRRDDSLDLDLLDLDEVSGVSRSAVLYQDTDDETDTAEDQEVHFDDFDNRDVNATRSFSCVDLQSTIASLLHQANATSSLMQQQAGKV